MILICHRSLQLCLWFIKLAGGGGSEEEGSIKVHNNKSACIAKKRIDTRTCTRTRTRSARTSTCSDCLSQEEEDFFWPIKVLAHGFIQHSSPRTTQTSFEQTEKNRNFLFQNFQNKFQFFFYQSDSFCSIHIRKHGSVQVFPLVLCQSLISRMVNPSVELKSLEKWISFLFDFVCFVANKSSVDSNEVQLQQQQQQQQCWCWSSSTQLKKKIKKAFFSQFLRWW